MIDSYLFIRSLYETASGKVRDYCSCALCRVKPEIWDSVVFGWCWWWCIVINTIQKYLSLHPWKRISTTSKSLRGGVRRRKEGVRSCSSISRSTEEGHNKASVPVTRKASGKFRFRVVKSSQLNRNGDKTAMPVKEAPWDIISNVHDEQNASGGQGATTSMIQVHREQGWWAWDFPTFIT